MKFSLIWKRKKKLTNRKPRLILFETPSLLVIYITWAFRALNALGGTVVVGINMLRSAWTNIVPILNGLFFFPPPKFTTSMLRSQTITYST